MSNTDEFTINTSNKNRAKKFTFTDDQTKHA